MIWCTAAVAGAAALLGLAAPAETARGPLYANSSHQRRWWRWRPLAVRARLEGCFGEVRALVRRSSREDRL